MRDPSLQLRTAIWQAISDIHMEIGQPAVGVYDELAQDNATYPRIILLDCIGGDNDNSKCGFGGDWSQTIKISDSFTGGASKNTIDGLSDIIMQRLVVTDPLGILPLPDFDIWNVQGSVVFTQRYSDGTRKYIDKNLRITFSLTEK